MQLKLASHAICPFVHRAAAMLHEKGVEFELEFVDLANKPAWFLEISPRGKVPVLVADGKPLFESAAIVEFLDETHPPHVVPRDPFERARQRAWIEVVNDVLLAQYKYTMAPAAERDAAKTSLVAVLARFEPVVVGPFFAGDAIGIVDFAIAPAFVRARLRERWTGERLLAELPKVEAWAKTLAEWPSVTRAMIHDFEDRFRALLVERGALVA